jgi:pimeloyl-ACP methyl ester carboxylesterase
MIHFYHGLIGNHRHFSNVVVNLNWQIGTCKVPDIPFFEADFDDLVARLRTGSQLPAVRVGNSIGCTLAVKTAGPDDHLILTAPPFDYSRGMVPLRKALVRDWVKGLYVQHGNIQGEEAFLADATAQVHRLLSNRAQIKRLRRYKAAAQSFWNDPLLADQQDRITFVIGESDFTTPIDVFTNQVRQHLPGASVEVWKECGHAVPLDAPANLAALIRYRWLCLGMGDQRFAQSA